MRCKIIISAGAEPLGPWASALPEEEGDMRKRIFIDVTIAGFTLANLETSGQLIIWGI